jgi:hypothetical protein
VTTKTHPVTGRPVPDERAQVPVERYVNPRKAHWPEADYVVGNPPFIGDKRLKQVLGEGYVDALRSTWKELPESADFVMHWWHIAAELARAGKIQRFGFISTNSLRQIFNRRIVDAHLAANPPLRLAFAIPDHPWVDSADGAAVRIAMTVGTGENVEGDLHTVAEELAEGLDGATITLLDLRGQINADLTIGADLTRARHLQSNGHISSFGVSLHGAGFIVNPEEAKILGLGCVLGLDRHIRAYRNGRDLMGQPRGVMVIDLLGLTAEDVRTRFPSVYQWVLERVKPERDHNNRASYRENWWIHAEPRRELRPALEGLCRFVATAETARHRIFQFLPGEILPDHKLIAIALEDSFSLGVLSSRVHCIWALRSGAWMGIGNDPVYSKSKCFEPFPFPITENVIHNHLVELGEALDAHRKARQAACPGLTLTGMYNVLEALRQGRPLTAKEKEIHEQGLVSVLGSLHDDIDRAVLAAYGWEDLAPALVGKPGGTLPLANPDPAQAAAQEELLARLVALNAERAAEEKRGLVRWLRPDFQCRDRAAAPRGVQTALEVEAETPAPSPGAGAASAAPKRPWPKALKDQIRAVREVRAQGAATVEEIAARFKRGPLKGVQAVLEALELLE